MNLRALNLHAIELGTLNAALFEYELPLKRPLVTGSGTTRSRRGVLLRLSVRHPTGRRGGRRGGSRNEAEPPGWEETVGWGEAAPLPGRSTEDLAEVIASLRKWLSIESFDSSLHALLTRARTHLKHSPCAWAAAGGALADLASRQLGIPLFEFLRQLHPSPPPSQPHPSPHPSATPPSPISRYASTLPRTDKSPHPSAESTLPGVDLSIPASSSHPSTHPSAEPLSPISVPTAVLLDGETPESVAREARRAHSAGYTTFKLKAGFNSFEHDLKRVAALRSAVGSDADIRIDVNGAWSPAEALPRLEALAEYRPEFVEEPCQGLEEIRLLQADSPVSLAVDESLPPLSDLLGLRDSQTEPAPIPSASTGGTHEHLNWSSQTETAPIPSSSSALEDSDDFADVGLGLDGLTALGVDTAVLKPSVLGAVTELLSAAAALHAAGTKVVISSALESAVGLTTALHLAAALGSGTAVGLGTSDLLAVDLCEPPLSANGNLVVPSGPGLGVAPVWETAPLRRLNPQQAPRPAAERSER